MTAFQPNPEKLTAQEELGGLRPPMTTERQVALGQLGLAVESPRHAARQRDRKYFQHKLGLPDVVEPRSPEDTAALQQLRNDLREKKLPSMVNDPNRVTERILTPEEAAARIVSDAHASWDEVNSAIEDRTNLDRLF